MQLCGFVLGMWGSAVMVLYGFFPFVLFAISNSIFIRELEMEIGTTKSACTSELSIYGTNSYIYTVAEED